MAARSNVVSIKRSKAPHRQFTVDIHCHVHNPAADELVKPAFDPASEPMAKFSNDATRQVNREQTQNVWSMLTAVETRLKDMDKMGIDIQAISPAPFQYFYSVEPELGRQAARLVNDNIAGIVAGHPDRFVGLGTVPLQNTELAVAELERAVKQLGLRGVEICTNVAGAELSEARFRPFFAKAEELDVVVFMHPGGFTHGQRLSDHYFSNVIGNPLDSTVAVSHLIFGGVLDAYPKLKLVVAHGGGFLPAYSGRMDHAHGARSDCRREIPKKKPTSYLKKLYFDTIVFTHHQLEYLVEQWGADHIVLGTDYPYDMGMYDPVAFVDGARKLSRDDRGKIAGGNAAKLLKIRPPKEKKTKTARKAKKGTGAKR
jgi:aminocarboxymuconate-semialdehyde decarboxylase